jgi:hypothetical protein
MPTKKELNPAAIPLPIMLKYINILILRDSIISIANTTDKVSPSKAKVVSDIFKKGIFPHDIQTLLLYLSQ